MQFTIIGNPENRRAQTFCEAAVKLGHPAPIVMAYTDWLSGNTEKSIPANSVLKLESPGENAAVRKMLVSRGMQNIKSDYSDTDILNHHGIISHMPAWYAGYCSLLDEISTVLKQEPSAKPMNDTATIQLQFDKPRCQLWMQQHGIPVPSRLERIAGYDDLLQKMHKENLSRVFIKPAHASSASGVIAFRKNKHKIQAVSSAEIVHSNSGIHLFNSLKVRTYSNEQTVAALIDHIAIENVFAEEWLPKATLVNRYFDFRVLVIDGKARHTVLRTSNHIITNLHLGNRRGDTAQFMATIGEEKWRNVQQLAEQAAACFPSSLYMGVDILLSADLKKAVVLEVNAFGDLLPGLMDEGESCYEAQINAMVKKLS